MQKIKLIALDLDGTTLDENSRLSERTKKTLERAAEAGIYLVVASGRAYTSLPSDVMDMKGITYAITSNGAAVYDPGKRERSFAYPMNRYKVEALLELLEEEPETAFEVFWQGIPYTSRSYLEDPESYGAPSRAVPYLRQTRTPAEDIFAFAREHADGLDALDIICPGPLDKAEWIEKVNGLGGLYLTSSTPHLLELSGEESGKGAALREAAARLGVSPEEIIAFGNAENDIDMLRFAGLGVAVANSPENVKRHADRIAPANTEEGVAQVLEEILFKS